MTIVMMPTFFFQKLIEELEQVKDLTETDPQEAIARVDRLANSILKKLPEDHPSKANEWLLDVQILEHLCSKMARILELANKQAQIRGISLNNSAIEETLASVSLKAQDFGLPFLRMMSRNMVFFAAIPKMSLELENLLSLSGTHPVLSLNFFIDSIELFAKVNGEFLSQAEQDHLRVIKQRLSQAAKWGNQINNLSLSFLEDQREGIKKVVASIENEAASLKEGEHLIVPGGTSGHSVMFKITRKGQAYDLEIYNTGDGAYWKGAKGKDPLQRYKQSGSASLYSLKIEDFPLSQDSLSAILSPKLSMDMTMDGLLDIIKKLGGKEGEGDKYPSQLRGSCVYESVLAYLKGSLQRAVFRTLQLQIAQGGALRVAALWQEFREDLQLLLSMEAARNLTLRESKFAKKVSKWEKNPEEFQHYQALVKRALGRELGDLFTSDDRAIALELVRKNSENYQYLPEDLRNDPEIALEAVKENVFLFLKIGPKLREDSARYFPIVLVAVRQFGGVLAHASMDAQNNVEIVKAAVNQYPLSINYAANELKKSEEFKEILLVAIERGFVAALNTANRTILSDADFFQRVIKKDLNGLAYMDSSLLNNRSILDSAIDKAIEVLQKEQKTVNTQTIKDKIMNHMHLSARRTLEPFLDEVIHSRGEKE